MQFGLFSESGYRQNAVPADAFEEDLFEIVLGDRLGFSEVWIAEPNHVRANTVTNANFIICKAAPLTRRIRFGTGIRQLCFLHPIDVVQEANMCDQLTRGRYMLGYGGTRVMDLHQGRQRGMVSDTFDARAMVYESIELIMQCWTSPEPFDFEGRFWQGTRIDVQPKPFQQPHPPVATACSGNSETLEIAGRYGFIPLMGRGNDKALEIRQWADSYVQAAEACAHSPTRREIRVTHFVYVSHTVKKARDEVRGDLTRIIEWRKRTIPHILQTRVPPGGTLDDLTFDYMVDSGYFWVGDPDSISQLIADYYQESGGFGVLLLSAALPVATRSKRARSMRLFMEQVAPRVADLHPD